ncbi:MAG: YkvA family protein [Microcystaceae cyanobacterium]
MSISVQSIYDWYRNTLRNPKYRWWIILGSLLYIISPIDIAPDFIPIVGQIDDLIVLTALLSEVSQLVLDYAKTRQSDSASASESAKNETIDIDAVSVK